MPASSVALILYTTKYRLGGEQFPVVAETLAEEKRENVVHLFFGEGMEWSVFCLQGKIIELTDKMDMNHINDTI